MSRCSPLTTRTHKDTSKTERERRTTTANAAFTDTPSPCRMCDKVVVLKALFNSCQHLIQLHHPSVPVLWRHSIESAFPRAHHTPLRHAAASLSLSVSYSHSLTHSLSFSLTHTRSHSSCHKKGDNSNAVDSTRTCYGNNDPLSQTKNIQLSNSHIRSKRRNNNWVLGRGQLDMKIGDATIFPGGQQRRQQHETTTTTQDKIRQHETAKANNIKNNKNSN